jgi:hypothetical protein
MDYHCQHLDKGKEETSPPSWKPRSSKTGVSKPIMCTSLRLCSCHTKVDRKGGTLFSTLERPTTSCNAIYLCGNAFCAENNYVNLLYLKGGSETTKCVLSGGTKLICKESTSRPADLECAPTHSTTKMTLHIIEQERKY